MPFAATLARSCALLLVLAGLPLSRAETTLPAINALLKNIEAPYNRSQSLKLDFSETYTGTKAPVQRDSGVLYLRKPGRMRWEYSSPAGKLFISDGKDVFFYSPGDT